MSLGLESIHLSLELTRKRKGEEGRLLTSIPINVSLRSFASLISLDRHKEITSDEIPFEDEDSYFSSYSHYSIHEEMLKVSIILTR